MPLSTAAIPTIAPASDFTTVLGPIAALAAAAVLVALVVLVAGLVVEALDTRANARMRTRLHEEPAAPATARTARPPRAA